MSALLGTQSGSDRDMSAEKYEGFRGDKSMSIDSFSSQGISRASSYTSRGTKFVDLGSVSVQGLGVGLNIVNNLVQCMGGSLDFSSVPGETTFCISLPLTPCNEPENSQANLGADYVSSFKNWKKGAVSSSFDNNAKGWTSVFDSPFAAQYMDEKQDYAEVKQQANKKPPVGLRAMSSSNPHILIVDDNTICQKVARHMVVKMGFTCDIACNGLEAVEMLDNNRNLYDLVFMDLRMPVCDGLTALNIIREKLDMHALPIVAFTADAGQECRQECMESGFDGFISKPAATAVLSAEIERLVLNKQMKSVSII